MGLSVNPCSPAFTETPLIQANRTVITTLLALQLLIYFVLRVLTSLGNHNEVDIVKEIVKNKTKIMKNFLQDPRETTEMHLKSTVQGNSNKDQETDSSSQDSEEKTSQKVAQKVEKYDIRWKTLKIKQKESSWGVCILAGHHWICAAFALLHFPFSLASICCLLHAVFLIFLLIWGLNSVRLMRFFIGTMWLMNIFLLLLGVYGLNTSFIDAATGICVE